MPTSRKPSGRTLLIGSHWTISGGLYIRRRRPAGVTCGRARYCERSTGWWRIVTQQGHCVVERPWPRGVEASARYDALRTPPVIRPASVTLTSIPPATRLVDFRSRDRTIVSWRHFRCHCAHAAYTSHFILYPFKRQRCQLFTFGHLGLMYFLISDIWALWRSVLSTRGH